MSSPTTVPVYYELSWAILSSIGIINVLFGIMIASITNLSLLSAVPIVVSAAGAVANGLCYYAFYADYPIIGTVVAAVFADILWLVQEAGLAFYSYFILVRILKNPERKYFVAAFWSFMVIITVIRAVILFTRAKDIINNDLSGVFLSNHLHIGYFSSIACVEVLNSFFLLRVFAAAKRSSKSIDSHVGLFRWLMRSTEIRLASLGLIGVTRAVTYSFQTQAQAATNVSSEVDRFVYTLECMFPIMMFIDVLASKLTLNDRSKGSTKSRTDPEVNGNGYKNRSRHYTNRQTFPLSNIETRVEGRSQVRGGRSSSQEGIIELGGHEIDDYGEIHVPNGYVNKTVEVSLHDSIA